MEELPEETLLALGFYRTDCPYTDGKVWTHIRAQGRVYYEILTPHQVMTILIGLGHMEFRQRALTEIESIDLHES